MRYDGPIYRPPSEADSLLVQATVGCPHNLCTFCMVYKDGVKFKVRPVAEIKADLDEAAATSGQRVRTLFFPAGNTIAMPVAALAEICRYSYNLFPRLERITVYGSSQYIHRKGPDQLQTLAQAGLGRIHVGVESGDDVVLTRIKKGATARDHIRAGQMARAAGLDLNAYVILGLGGQDRSETHARETARVISEMQPEVVRLRTFVPKINTPLLADVQAGRFKMLSPHRRSRKPWPSWRTSRRPRRLPVTTTPTISKWPAGCPRIGTPCSRSCAGLWAATSPPFAPSLSVRSNLIPG